VLENQKLNQSITYLGKFRELGLLFFIVILSIGITLRNPAFMTIGNLSNLLTNTAILSILALGMMMILITRGIDLSVGATLALSGMIAAQFVSAFPHLPAILAVLLGIVVGAVSGLILGFLIAKFGILPIIASLGLMNVYRGLTFWVSGGSWISAYEMPNSFTSIATSKILGVNLLIIIAVIIYIGFYYMINHSKLGRKIYAVGSNPDSAKVNGIKVDRIIIFVYTTMGSLAGLSGVLWVSKFASAQGDTGMGYELTVIAACIIGGVSIAGGSGKIGGVLLGAILLGILANAFPLIGISPFWQMGVEGFIILAAVLFNVYVNRAVKRNNLALREV